MWALGPIRGGDDQTSKLPNKLPQTQASFAHAPQQLPYSKLSLRKPQEIKEGKKIKNPIAAVTATEEALREQPVLASRRQCSRTNAGATTSSRTKMKIKLLSRAKMIDDGEGRRRFWGQGKKKQPESAWRREMLAREWCRQRRRILPHAGSPQL